MESENSKLSWAIIIGPWVSWPFVLPSIKSGWSCFGSSAVTANPELNTQETCWGDGLKGASDGVGFTEVVTFIVTVIKVLTKAT